MSKNVKMSNPMKVITGPDTRWSYANVWEPKSINGGAPKYSVSLIIPKSDTKTVAKVNRSSAPFVLSGLLFISALPMQETSKRTWPLPDDIAAMLWIPDISPSHHIYCSRSS